MSCRSITPSAFLVSFLSFALFIPISLASLPIPTYTRVLQDDSPPSVVVNQQTGLSYEVEEIFGVGITDNGDWYVDVDALHVPTATTYPTIVKNGDVLINYESFGNIVLDREFPFGSRNVNDRGQIAMEIGFLVGNNQVSYIDPSASIHTAILTEGQLIDSIAAVPPMPAGSTMKEIKTVEINNSRRVLVTGTFDHAGASDQDIAILFEVNQDGTVGNETTVLRKAGDAFAPIAGKTVSGIGDCIWSSSLSDRGAFTLAGTLSEQGTETDEVVTIGAASVGGVVDQVVGRNNTPSPFLQPPSGPPYDWGDLSSSPTADPPASLFCSNTDINYWDRYVFSGNTTFATGASWPSELKSAIEDTDEPFTHAGELYPSVFSFSNLISIGPQGIRLNDHQDKFWLASFSPLFPMVESPGIRRFFRNKIPMVIHLDTELEGGFLLKFDALREYPFDTSRRRHAIFTTEYAEVSPFSQGPTFVYTADFGNRCSITGNTTEISATAGGVLDLYLTLDDAWVNDPVQNPGQYEYWVFGSVTGDDGITLPSPVGTLVTVPLTADFYSQLTLDVPNSYPVTPLEDTKAPIDVPYIPTNPGSPSAPGARIHIDPFVYAPGTTVYHAVAVYDTQTELFVCGSEMAHELELTN